MRGILPGRIISSKAYSRGQGVVRSFMRSDYYADTFTKQLGELRDDDLVVEIEPGLGHLTESIFKRSMCQVICVEKDEYLVEYLNERFRDHKKRFVAVRGDILNLNFKNLLNEYGFDLKKEAGAGVFRIVGNLPPDMSKKVLANLFCDVGNRRGLFKDDFEYMMLLSFHEEIARKIIAQDDIEYRCATSLIAQYLFDVKKTIDLPQTAFKPKLPVQTSVLKFVPKHLDSQLQHPYFFAFFREIATSIFTAKNKSIYNILRNNIRLKFGKHFLNELNLESKLQSMGIDPSLTPPRISNRHFYSLIDYLFNLYLFKNSVDR